MWFYAQFQEFEEDKHTNMNCVQISSSKSATLSSSSACLVSFAGEYMCSSVSKCWFRSLNFSNYNYGLIGDGLKVGLLNHPGYIEQMTQMKKQQPSVRDVFVGNRKPTKNDTLSEGYLALEPPWTFSMETKSAVRVTSMTRNNIISHYQYYRDLMSAGRGYSRDNLDCAEQVPFNPSLKSESSWAIKGWN